MKDALLIVLLIAPAMAQQSLEQCIGNIRRWCMDGCRASATTTPEAMTGGMARR
jgi:hypothetical protein